MNLKSSALWAVLVLTGLASCSPKREFGDDSDGATGGGGGDSSSTGGAAAGGADGTGGAENPINENGPELVSVSPADGSSEIMDEPLVLTFSAAMNRESVESLFPGETFEWSEGDTTVTISTPWAYSSKPSAYTLTLPNTILGADNERLKQETKVTFVLAALISKDIAYDVNLTGYSATGSTANYSFLRAGDNTADTTDYGGFTFPLADLPAFDSILKLRSAKIHIQVCTIVGNPNNLAMGDFLLDHVSFASRGTIDNPTILQAGFAVLFPAGELVSAAPAKLIDVATQLENSWSDAATQIQFRAYPTAVSANATADRISLRRVSSDSNCDANPDADNALLLQVQYFD
ncbi:MAG TPA: Ig-like domain-containing protein [Polyangiaceae bacterium]|nr:Ig-like domain-containing protein [Polyangiaceae bacterium]